MENETEKIIEEQIEKLPKEIIDFILSGGWNTNIVEIGSLYNLSREEIIAFKREVLLVLVGLTHPDEFSEVLAREVGLQGAVLEAIVKNVEEKIFAPILPTLIDFFEKENVKMTEEVVEEVPAPINEETLFAPVPTPTRTWEKTPDIAPNNLPTVDETEPLFPPIPPKTATPDFNFDQTTKSTDSETKLSNEETEPAHPFEEKMKRVFTGGQQSVGEFTIEAAAPQVSATETPQSPKAPPIYHADPYREAIE